MQMILNLFKELSNLEKCKLEWISHLPGKERSRLESIFRRVKNASLDTQMREKSTGL